MPEKIATEIGILPASTVVQTSTKKETTKKH